MKGNIYMIVAQNGFRDEELLIPQEYFKEKGYDIIILSKEKGLCTGSISAEIQSDLSIRDAHVDDTTKAVLVIGGPQSPTLMDVPELGTLLKEAKEKGLVVGAICLGPMMLAHFGVIDGMHATVFATSDSLAKLKERKIVYVNEDVVVDDKLVTANGPQAARAFAENVVETVEE